MSPDTLLGTGVTASAPMGGGSLSQVTRVTLTDGRTVVLKSAPEALAEARMLRAIAASGCPVPELLDAREGQIVMTLLDAGGTPDDNAWEAAGAAIARLHMARGNAYGWHSDHAFGDVPIPNGWSDDWPLFWSERRLLPTPRDIPPSIARRLERLARSLPDRLPATPPPALLHGDLWSGNLLFGATGFSGVIDPAAYHGDPEVDLAMLTLFGRPPAAFSVGYGRLAPGWEERRAIYQLWPALVHLRLFGSGYRNMVEGLLDSTGS